MQWNWWRLENELQSFHHPAEMSGILHLQSKKENAKENWEGCFKEKYCSELQPKKTKSMRTSISKRWDPFQKKQFLTKYASWNPVKLLRRITQMRCQILFSNLLLAQKKAFYSSKFQPKVQNNPKGSKNVMRTILTIALRKKRLSIGLQITSKKSLALK